MWLCVAVSRQLDQVGKLWRQIPELRRACELSLIERLKMNSRLDVDRFITSQKAKLVEEKSRLQRCEILP